MYLEYGVKESTPWDNKGDVVARYGLRSDALKFIQQERRIQAGRGVEKTHQLHYTLVRYRKVKK